MSVSSSSARAARTVQRLRLQSEICTCLSLLTIRSRPFSISSSRDATPTLHPTTTQDQNHQSSAAKSSNFVGSSQAQPPSYVNMSPAERAALAAERARARLQAEQQKYSASRKLGGLADGGFFADGPSAITTTPAPSTSELGALSGMSQRNLDNMAFAINPRPNARARWQRKMLIRHIRRRGRLPRELQIARTERSHLSKSHFFKTSVKKLAPLARQISGKSIDEAILQMRFSQKKAAEEVRNHLIQAKNEAIVTKGMGLGDTTVVTASTSTDALVAASPDITPPASYQNAAKSVKEGVDKSQTDIYVAQAWVNRGPYGKEPEFRARGRVNMLRPPWTGISVLLKEEKTRTREKADKEAKMIRKRMGRNMWVQLPDRPITRQSQYVLW